MNSKTLLSGAIAGVVLFLLGWLVYGILLADYYADVTNQCIMLPMEEFNPGYMFISNLLYGYLLAMVLTWANVNSGSEGATKAFFLSLFYGISMAFSFSAMSDYYTGLYPAIIDGVIWAVMSAIGGWIIGWYMNRGK